MRTFVNLDEYPVGTQLQEHGTNRKCRITKITQVHGFVVFLIAFLDGETRRIFVRDKDILTE